MAQQSEVGWPTCDQGGCIGARLSGTRKCLAHGNEDERQSALTLIRHSGVVDVRGVRVTPALLEQILSVSRREPFGQPLIRTCRFDRTLFAGDVNFGAATFTNNANFTRATFIGDAEFTGATFDNDVLFSETTFADDTRFTGATFAGKAEFFKASFGGDVTFSGATFKRDAFFRLAAFSGIAEFVNTTFTGLANFSDATFARDAWFNMITFGDEATFTKASFGSGAEFFKADFSNSAWFDGVKFEEARQFGPLLTGQKLILDNVQFAQPVRIEASAVGLCCRQARFAGGVQFRLRWAHVLIDDSDFSAPSTLAGVPPMGGRAWYTREKQLADNWQQLHGDISEQPQLISMRRANVAGLALSNLSATNCRFAGAHSLDKLRLESNVSFGTAPVPLGSSGRGWGAREVIAEERTWRAHQVYSTTANADPRTGKARWIAPMWPDWLNDETPDVLEPGQIAGLYRALRKGREDVKDEPGVADFYYGEMEMRRHARQTRSDPALGSARVVSRGWAEHSILTIYWMISGYGLRAWRAIACLATVTVLFATAFHLVGFTIAPKPNSYWTSGLYSFRATLSLTDDRVTLTGWGQLLQAILRVIGPVLVGLALLALRGRTKR